MDAAFLIKGLILGFSIAAPVGPISLLCIRRTLTEGRSSGLATGLGAATADSIYAFVAAFSLTAVSSFLLDYKMPIHLIGSAFLFYLAITIFFSHVSDQKPAVLSPGALAYTYITSVFLTLTNPTTILSFIAVFAGLGLAEAGTSFADAGSMVAGVFVGSSLWGVILTTGVNAIRDRLTPKHLLWVNRISGGLIAALGIISLLNV